MCYYRHIIKTIGQLDLIIFIQSSTRCGTSGIRCARKRRLSKGRSRSHKGQRLKRRRGDGGERRREALRQCVIGVTLRGQQKERARMNGGLPSAKC